MASINEKSDDQTKQPIQQEHADEDDDSIPNVTSAFLLCLPVEMREKVYSFLRPSDLVNLRLVCDQLRLESEFGGRFIVRMTEEHSHLQDVTIPFPSLHLLLVDTDTFELPWGDCVNDQVQRLLLQNLTFKTFITIGKFSSVQDATLTSLVFQRPVPPLSWTRLKSLQIVFHVAEHFIERFMLENLDTLLEQKFDSLKNLRISLMNLHWPSEQSIYSIRLARFVAKHWRTLCSLEVEMQGRCTDTVVANCPHHPTELSVQERHDFLKKVCLQNLEMRVTELSCPRCAIWQDFVRGQTKLKCLLINIIEAGDLPPNFFCNNTLNQFQDLAILSLNLWEVDYSFKPFDFKYLEKSKGLTFCELAHHYGTTAEEDLTESELVNVELIPEKLTKLLLDGFIIESLQVTTILEKLTNLSYITLLNSGTGLTLGLQSHHIGLLSTLSHLSCFFMDFITEEETLCYGKSTTIIKCKMDDAFPADEWISRLRTTCFSSNYHRFLVSKINAKEKLRDEEFSIYDKLTKCPPRRYPEVEDHSFFQIMRDVVMTSRFSAILYDLATSTV